MTEGAVPKVEHTKDFKRFNKDRQERTKAVIDPKKCSIKEIEVRHLNRST